MYILVKVWSCYDARKEMRFIAVLLKTSHVLQHLGKIDDHTLLTHELSAEDGVSGQREEEEEKEEKAEFTHS